METIKNEIEFWGTINNQSVYLYHLSNSNNIAVCITNFGATITSILTPDKAGERKDIVLGYDKLEDYMGDDYYFGSIVGRVANRIAGGVINLEGDRCQLTLNRNGFHHHGGEVGFNKKLWKSGFETNGDHSSVKLEYLSKDGEEGAPGNLLVTVTYTLNDNNQLIVDYSATTDKTTVLNLTQHSYFNLAGHDSGDISTHKLTMPMEYFLPVNQIQVPTGEIRPVKDTPFDFRTAKTIGRDIGVPDEQLKLGYGYDNSWVIKQKNSDELEFAAKVSDDTSGRILTVYTTEPAAHLYTGNFLDNVPGKRGAVYERRGGFCLETQQFPDAPNHQDFPDIVLKKDQTFKSRTIFQFGME